MSDDGGATWHDSGSVFDDLVDSTNVGALKLIPLASTFGAGSSTRSRKIKVMYTLDATNVSINDIFEVIVHPTVDIAILANSQLQTLAFNPHVDVVYTLGDQDLDVASIDYQVNYPVDPKGFNDFTSLNAPSATTIKLQFYDGNSWEDITLANYASTGVVGLSSTKCMDTLDSSSFAFTLSCSDNNKFGTTSSGVNVYHLRYKVYYTDVPSNIRYLYDSFTVTIKN